MRRIWRIIYRSWLSFSDDDGWAIASHIALSALMALFPFLIVVTALAGAFGSQQLADEVARILFEAWPKEVAEPIAGAVHDVRPAVGGCLLGADPRVEERRRDAAALVRQAL